MFAPFKLSLCATAAAYHTRGIMMPNPTMSVYLYVQAGGRFIRFTD